MAVYGSVCVRQTVHHRIQGYHGNMTSHIPGTWRLSTLYIRIQDLRPNWNIYSIYTYSCIHLDIHGIRNLHTEGGTEKNSPDKNSLEKRPPEIRGGPFDIWGGRGGIEEIVPEQSIYFFPVRNNVFYFTMSEKQIFFSVLAKDETIFLVLIMANIRASPRASITWVW